MPGSPRPWSKSRHHGIAWPIDGYLLRDFVPTLMLSHEQTAEYITKRKAEWAKLRQGNAKSRLDMEFFLARFNPANYTETPQDDGQVMVTMRWPPHLEEIATRSQGENELKMLALTLAMRARRLLEGQATMIFFSEETNFGAL